MSSAAAAAADAHAVPRIVLDTNVCLDLFLFRDPGCAALAAAIAAGQVCPVADAACRDEWLRVLHYPSVPIRAEQRETLRQRFDATMRRFDGAAPVDAPALPACRDPDDQMFLELARAAGAPWLLSKDRDLLKLARRTRKAGLFLILPPAQWTPALIGRALLPQA